MSTIKKSTLDDIDDRGIEAIGECAEHNAVDCDFVLGGLCEHCSVWKQKDQKRCEKMENFTKIDTENLMSLSVRDQQVYRATLNRMSVWDYLVQCGVALDGHFVFTGGGHGNVYVNIRDLNNALVLSPLAMQMAWEVREERIDAIVGTPHGADTLAVLVTYYYTQFTTWTPQILKPLKKGNKLVWYKDHGTRVQGAQILQIEDVVNSAGSLCEAAEFIRDSGGLPLGFFTVCNRLSDKNPGLEALQQKLDVKYAYALTEVKAENYSVDLMKDPSEQCPHCAAGEQINMRVGHGTKFLVQIKGKYPDLYKKLKG